MESAIAHNIVVWRYAPAVVLKAVAVDVRALDILDHPVVALPVEAMGAGRTIGGVPAHYFSASERPARSVCARCKRRAGIGSLAYLRSQTLEIFEDKVCNKGIAACPGTTRRRGRRRHIPLDELYRDVASADFIKMDSAHVRPGWLEHRPIAGRGIASPDRYPARGIRHRRVVAINAGCNENLVADCRRASHGAREAAAKTGLASAGDV